MLETIMEHQRHSTATASGTQACNSGNRDSGCIKDQRTVSTDPVIICDAAIC